ncbi:hypothetical protein ACRRTK_018722 [Alexandromys fortis]
MEPTGTEGSKGPSTCSDFSSTAFERKRDILGSLISAFGEHMKISGSSLARRSPDLWRGAQGGKRLTQGHSPSQEIQESGSPHQHPATAWAHFLTARARSSLHATPRFPVPRPPVPRVASDARRPPGCSPSCGRSLPPDSHAARHAPSHPQRGTPRQQSPRSRDPKEARPAATVTSSAPWRPRSRLQWGRPPESPKVSRGARRGVAESGAPREGRPRRSPSPANEWRGSGTYHGLGTPAPRTGHRRVAGVAEVGGEPADPARVSP